MFAPTAKPCTDIYDTDGVLSRFLGRRWSDGRNASIGVFTILPPNSPTVCRGAQNTNPEGWSIVAASSNHPGGASTVAVDASYRFVTNSVDTSSNPPPRKSGITVTGLSLSYSHLEGGAPADHPEYYAGPSPYGIWGAYGSVSGGESTSL